MSTSRNTRDYTSIISTRSSSSATEVAVLNPRSAAESSQALADDVMSAGTKPAIKPVAGSRRLSHNRRLSGEAAKRSSKQPTGKLLPVCESRREQLPPTPPLDEVMTSSEREDMPLPLGE